MKQIFIGVFIVCPRFPFQSLYDNVPILLLSYFPSFYPCREINAGEKTNTVFVFHLRWCGIPPYCDLLPTTYRNKQ